MASATPVITALMCVYNGAQVIPASIASILNQSFGDFELIIIDDGSTDETPEVLASYRDSRITVVRQEHCGVTAALQHGLERARGTFVARLDADDMASPDRFKQQVEFFRHHPETALVATDAVGEDQDGNVVWETDLPDEGVAIAWRLLWYNCIVHSSVMFRAACVRELGGYHRSLPYAQDYDLWLRIAAHFPIGIVKAPLVTYRVHHPSSITICHKNEQFEWLCHVQEEAISQINPHLRKRASDIRVLGAFLYLNGTPPPRLAEADELLHRLYTAFCASPFARSATSSSLQRIMREPYLRFAWEYFRQGHSAEGERCIHNALARGNGTPIIIPEDQLERGYDVVCRELTRKKDASLLLYQQHCTSAWQYFNRGSMRGFRHCLRRAWRLKWSVSLALMWLLSFVGKQFFDEINDILQQLSRLITSPRSLEGARQ
ncbi:MAG: glycosyltransferase [Desulfobacterota bacterium]|nr:glycosyltransferase [Thermodesulfobacteriota bacterium]